MLRESALFSAAVIDVFIVEMLNYTDENYDTLKKTIYHEARGEPHAGQIAVVSIIMNRTKDAREYFGITVSEVCKKSYQFECWYARRV